MNKNFFQSKNFKKIIYGLGILIIVLIVFQAGIFVGYRKAGFSYRWGDNYYRAFGGHRRGEGMMGEMAEFFRRGGDFTSSSGVTGKIISISLPSVAVESPDGIEKIISITDDTLIKRFRETLAPADLKVGNFIIAIGSPDDNSQIEARIIRIIPDYQNQVGTTTGAKINNNK